MDKDPKKKTASINFSCAVLSLLDILTLEAGTDRLSQNFGKELPFYTAYYLRIVQISHDLAMQALVGSMWSRSEQSSLALNKQI